MPVSSFFHSYKEQLTLLLNEKLGYKTENAELVTYLVSNTFHPQFRTVWNYYCKGPLELKQVVMGYMPDDKKSRTNIHSTPMECQRYDGSDKVTIP